MRPGGIVGDSTKLALIVDAIRGGSEAFDDEREIAEKIRVQLPGVKRMIGWADTFTAGAAELGAAAGIGSVVIGGTGFPVAGDPPHRAAAAASAAARFGYTSTSEVVVALRHRSLERDPRAVAFLASVLSPARLVGRARGAGLDGPLQVQWGLGAWLLSARGGADLAAGYAEALPPGSRVVMCAAEHAAGVGDLAGERMYGHSPEALAGWAAGSGLDVVLEVPDVRAWGRGGWAEGELRRDWAAGQVSGLVAAVRLAGHGADQPQRRVLPVFGLL